MEIFIGLLLLAGVVVAVRLLVRRFRSDLDGSPIPLEDQPLQPVNNPLTNWMIADSLRQTQNPDPASDTTSVSDSSSTDSSGADSSFGDNSPGGSDSPQADYPDAGNGGGYASDSGAAGYDTTGSGGGSDGSGFGGGGGDAF